MYVISIVIELSQIHLMSRDIGVNSTISSIGEYKTKEQDQLEVLQSRRRLIRNEKSSHIGLRMTVQINIPQEEVCFNIASWLVGSQGGDLLPNICLSERYMEVFPGVPDRFESSSRALCSYYTSFLGPPSDQPCQGWRGRNIPM